MCNPTFYIIKMAKFLHNFSTKEGHSDLLESIVMNSDSQFHETIFK